MHGGRGGQGSPTLATTRCGPTPTATTTTETTYQGLYFRGCLGGSVANMFGQHRSLVFEFVPGRHGIPQTVEGGGGGGREYFLNRSDAVVLLAICK